jgi:3-hydroxymyristoyl/3-hydroxydecanoyl-(acyl carrier protein) dehydratase
MRFLFVSKINSIEGDLIKGQVQFSSAEPWRRQVHGITEISTSVISEAIGQLVSWMELRNNDFTGRPVFLFATEINLQGTVKAPVNVELEAKVTDRSDNSFIFSGKAKVDGKIVVEIKDCGGYFMPLAELENPEVTRQRYATLISDGFPSNPGTPAFEFDRLIDEVNEIERGTSITASRVMRPNEPFYSDHFPRFPVTPIVIINEMIAEATRRMINGFPNSDQSIEPISVHDLKIKNFIRPGDTAVISVKLIESQNQEIETVAEITVNKKRILRGRYRYRRTLNS